MATVLNVNLKKSCTATIVSSLWLLTTLTCIHPANISSLEWFVVAGLNSSDILRDDQMQLRIVKEVLTHMTKDIALVRLDTSLAFGDLVQPACLTSSLESDEDDCLSVGWKFIKQGTHSINFCLKCEYA